MRIERATNATDRTSTCADRAAGLMIGAAVGDALGAPFEFGPAGAYRRRFPDSMLDGESEMVGGGAFGWAPGEFTDDSQMGLVLAESLVREGAYDVDDVWEGFRIWAADAIDVGAHTRWSLQHESWRDVPTEAAHSAGNGALMRSLPLAIAFLDADDDTVRNVVLHQAALTHQDPAAGWGSLVAVNVMRAALHEFRDPLGAIDATLSSMPTPVATVYEPLLNGSWEPSKPAPSNGSVWGCLAQALWSVRNNLGFEQAVVAAINLGGDTDTVACVAGAISGAIYGLGSIPERWVRNVNGSVDTSSGRAAYRANDITTLAHRLLG